MDFHKLISRYRQFGGLGLVIEYVKLGALMPAVITGVKCLAKRQSFKAIYPEVLKRVEPYLIQKYGSKVLGQAKRQSRAQEVKSSRSLSLEHKRSKMIWFCWLQGLEQAPPIVKACYNSLRRHLTDREIKVIDNENWKEYVDLPDYIVEKWKKGRIPAALFSDLLRLELLIKYGGTWIDSTVLCTGFKFQDCPPGESAHVRDSSIKFGSPLTQSQTSSYKWKEFLDADLFLFQYTKQGSIPVSISNWFIASCSNNDVLIVLRDMLYAYWKDYDCTLDYYIFHLFFSMLSKEYTEEILAMPYGQSMNSLVIMHHLGEKFNQEKWEKLTQRVSFHKLAFRVSKEIKEDKDNYFNKIISLYT